ncbi:cysteine dioxygenase [Paenibacillus sedimenti]|uniref:Cysteine dioxygenase family protein n=1 Tax=Paenibacillus sedimenti TaxID=2770274 RepID=A0A926KNS1_9BACL|nr:cysteine dioxygenase family protein [Paenibacillus sedimenti]MBD0380523.1 cysteine dioxygenase family protein [Paenibacillus sedimenti]
MTLLRAIERTFCRLQQPTHEQMKSALLSLGELLQTVPEYKTEPEQLPYGRNAVFSNKELEVIIIHIPANQSTAIHNHGSSIGTAYLVEGQLVNTMFTLDSYGYPVPEHDDFIQAGQCFDAPADQIHQLSNPFHERAISLHVYTPPLREVNRYLPYTDILDYVI